MKSKERTAISKTKKQEPTPAEKDTNKKASKKMKLTKTKKM